MTAAQTALDLPALQPDLFRDAALDVSPGRAEGDYYPTPAWLTRALLDRWWGGQQYGERFWRLAAESGQPLTLLDAGAGCGELGSVVEAWSAEHGLPAPAVTGIELDRGRSASQPAHWQRVQGDLFGWFATQDQWTATKWTLIVSNPPYHCWQPWVDALLQLRHTTVAVVGSVAVLGGQERAAWWRKHPPDEILISPRRPHFRGQGSDPRDTCWFVWGRQGWDGMTPSFGWLEV